MKPIFQIFIAILILVGLMLGGCEDRTVEQDMHAEVYNNAKRIEPNEIYFNNRCSWTYWKPVAELGELIMLIPIKDKEITFDNFIIVNLTSQPIHYITETKRFMEFPPHEGWVKLENLKIYTKDTKATHFVNSDKRYHINDIECKKDLQKELTDFANKQRAKYK